MKAMTRELARCDDRLRAKVRDLHRTTDPSEYADIREDIDELLDTRQAIINGTAR